MPYIEDLCTALEERGIGYIKDAMLRDFCTFRIGGPADIIVFPEDAVQMAAVTALARNAGAGYYLLGNGSNVLFDDNGYSGIIISTTAMGEVSVEDNNCIRAGCGAPSARIALTAMRAGLSGAEFLYGIPGSLGGAVYMNAGAYGSQIADIAASVTALDTKSGNLIELDASELKYSYRHSVFMERRELVIISALLKLIPGNPDDITAKMTENISLRRSKQPLELPSAGSVFKRHPGYYMGKIIEESGLKGATVGGAMVSEKHAGFIVNTGAATSEDVKALIALIKETIFTRYGFEPECEVIMPGKGSGWGNF